MSGGLGDCIDCTLCVQVCPTGIDIRNGLQYECIGCAACIDGCDQVMDKMGYPRGLIRYASEASLTEAFGWREVVRRVLRPRVLLYTGILWAIIIATGVTLALRVPLRVDVIRDRGTLAREIEGGLIENVYRLQLMNASERADRVTIAASGLPGITVAGEPQPVELAPSSARAVPIKVRAPYGAAAPGSHPIEFAVTSTGEAEPFTVREKSVFLLR